MLLVRPTDLAVAASVANILGLSSLSILDQKLLELSSCSFCGSRNSFYCSSSSRGFFGGSFVDGSVFA